MGKPTLLSPSPGVLQAGGESDHDGAVLRRHGHPVLLHLRAGEVSWHLPRESGHQPQSLGVSRLQACLEEWQREGAPCSPLEVSTSYPTVSHPRSPCSTQTHARDPALKQPRGPGAQGGQGEQEARGGGTSFSRRHRELLGWGRAAQLGEW